MKPSEQASKLISNDTPFKVMALQFELRFTEGHSQDLISPSRILEVSVTPLIQNKLLFSRKIVEILLSSSHHWASPRISVSFLQKNSLSSLRSLVLSAISTINEDLSTYIYICVTKGDIWKSFQKLFKLCTSRSFNIISQMAFYLFRFHRYVH